ncbi:MAG TPA: aminotransferase class I/II-fold pyridoxal phosphate-dependent enzyme [Candidatus Limnocylindrales bacterium]|nr:aminotransferase class I/II-fold pyridoxal phosphate-dependent enzyme [Candidatus Limnocylindrales bacterium]
MTRDAITPVTWTPPSAPASYSWEATDDEVAARYGIPLDRIIRFDLNTSPAPPDLAARILADGRFVTPLSEYPPSDYGRLVDAAAGRYGVGRDELLVGAGADEILDVIAKTFLGPGTAAIVPTPTYAMYRVVTEQRGARVIAVGRRSADEGWSLDVASVAAAASEANVVWLCSPNNPTGLAEPPGAIEALLDELASKAAATDRTPPVVVLDEAYAEFVGTSLVGLRKRYPRLIVIRTASKAYALAGLRVGFALARPEIIAEMAPYRPPGSVSTVSVTVVTGALSDDSILEANLARVERERDRLARGLRDAGWDVGPSVTNFLLAGFASVDRAGVVADGLLRRGLVPRTFGEGHPLASYIRVTVRDTAENDRLIEAAREIAKETTE